MINQSFPDDNDQLKMFLKEFDSKIICADKLAYAFLGVSKIKSKGYVAVYSTQAIIAHLMEEDMMDFETAENFMKVNILDKAISGKHAPIFVDIVPDIFWKV